MLENIADSAKQKGIKNIDTKVEAAYKTMRDMQKEIDNLKNQIFTLKSKEWATEAKDFGKVNVLIKSVSGMDAGALKDIVSNLKASDDKMVVMVHNGIIENYQELKEDLEAAGLKLVTIEELQQLAESMTGVPKPIETGDKVVCMVEYRDGTVLAQMSSSDMCFPIQYAVTWPDRVPNSLRQLNFAEIGQLVFEAPRPDAFPALDLARRAGASSSTLAAVYNAANEVAVDAFIQGKLTFPGIWRLVEAVMNDHSPADPRGELAPILEADQWARRRAAELIPSLSRPS